MTKKDYVLIAATIKRERMTDALEFSESHQQGELQCAMLATERVVFTLANAFRDDDPRFDWDRFVNACGVES